MFLVSDSLENRARVIREFLHKHPSIALIVAAVYFEWTLCRALMALSKRPNAEVRQSLSHLYGLEKYKELWWNETRDRPGALRLTQIVRDWDAVLRAFDERNRLIHGRNRHTRNMATPHVEALLAAVADLNRFCSSCQVDLNQRLPVRKRSRPIDSTRTT